MSSGSMEKSKQLLIWVLMIAVALIKSCHVHPCPEEERFGLLHLKAYLHNHSYDQEIFDWSDNGERYNCCAWDRVLCDLSTQRVIKLDLSSNVTNLESRRYHNKVWLFNVTLLSPFSKLISLDLSKNDIHGLVEHDGSTRISTLKSLQSLVLDDNPLQTDYVFMGGLTSLRTLSLQRCRLNHSIEALGLVNLTQLQVLKLTDNNFHGPIQGIANMRHLQVLDLSWNNLYDSIQGGDHLVMSALDFSCNKLSGVIPPELGDLRQIQSLNLSHNCFSGSIPVSFSNLKQVESLDLSYNLLIGTIPSQLSELNFLAIFNVSFNNLSGRTPEVRQFANFDQSNYLGNPRLCGLAVNKSCHQTNVLPPRTRKEDGDNDATLYMEDFLWCFGMSSFVAFLTIVAVLSINPQWRRAWFDFVECHILWWLL